MTETHVLPINAKDAALEVVGGKGRSLAEMANAGLAVPGGFYLTTGAYRRFVAENDLQAAIIDLVKPEIGEFTLSFDKASNAIQALFRKATLSDDMAAEIRQAYDALEGDDSPVAVRSSANAEDLPDMSFAGQQDTYLNVRGADAVVEAVRDCWASLWTSRAISYRHEMGIEQDTVAMAVVVQTMVPADVSGILFTANPTTGERSEMIINASFGLGEAVVGGQVTPDTYAVDRESLAAKKTIIGAKEQKIVSDGDQGTRLEDIAESERGQSSLSDDAIKELATLALKTEAHFEGVPQDIEWAYSDGKLYMLQSRPITNLPPQPIEVDWIPIPPAQILARRQIIENIPDPCTPLFDELYLSEGLETVEKGKKHASYMVGGGPSFVSLNGYAYQRFDWPQIIEARQKRMSEAMTDAEMDAAEIKVEADTQKKEQAKKKGEPSEKEKAAWTKKVAEWQKNNAGMAQHDLDLFLADLSSDERNAFDDWAESCDVNDVAARVTQPESKNPTFGAFNRTQVNENQIKGFYDRAKPDLMATSDEWRKVDPKTASDEQLLEGVCATAIAGGMYWCSNGGHTFGVAKSTDDQLQAFLREALPDHHFTSGQFLSGFKSKTMQANEHLFEIAKKIRADEALAELVIITPAKRMMKTLEEHRDAGSVVEAINEYLGIYGHLGYSLDFAEPLPLEDPSGLLATLKTMISNKDYDPKNHESKALEKREAAMAEILGILEGLQYWQFRFRHWFTHRFYYIREEVMFYLYMAWPVLRPLALELGQRLTDTGTITRPDHVFYLQTDELKQAIEARKENKAVAEYRQLTAERFELREARKRLHPPGTVPFDASEDPSVKFKETQVVNDPDSDTMLGVPVSPGTVTAPVSLINSPAEFDQMRPGSILVCPMTNPAWTPLFAHASGLVTDMGGILGHGSIVAREYGIPAVVGTGTITVRVKHGQQISVDGDSGTVKLLDD
ncbi:MAG: PEP/pyruvate-binding domain-containing protein [Pseudomonadales bacterium]|jgi:phosphohistidine swiveling domain-containing protein|nr:PEP/pyruvate-binding domain-containing protein [Pseudomonadales bacterium]MDP7358751.1 PEP/pyruvate-binding domain-containing protein [Pseudomonadales bacterium]MDP7596710.1 PEP/pyruvate-binding domain-containing protein [Pseudomonadales bacterium]HJN50326.1 PEP/pyruvate-binding domain-containing protein [Pseudomonadales bacterium]|tara:strand:- start:1713 stop:4592 length:2880 start_codon:yes stop_codon:yes gene_type:complete